MDNYARHEIHHICESMTIGESRLFDRQFFDAAFPSNPSTGRPSVDAFLESMIGANYGSYTTREDFETGGIIVSRHKTQASRVRDDFDRR